ncbi:GNAT family N-acetyltransferase [Janibacter sp. FSL W8-0316]|uniref:GNAT family N-acetyltransferase n=1 Tax=Janibacter sp. FSL W8-0316 TaxID=2975325 RepID=UPI0030FCA496
MTEGRGWLRACAPWRSFRSPGRLTVQAFVEVARLHGSPRRRYPIPAVLLARLAVDERSAGRGVGRQLLVHALRGFVTASRQVGFEMVVVHAFDVDAVTFYTTHGFTPFADNPMHLFLTTKELRATFDGL